MKGKDGVLRWLIGVALPCIGALAWTLLAPPAVQGSDDPIYLLRLAEPELPPLAALDWPQAVDLYQDAWAERRAPIIHRLMALQAIGSIRSFKPLPEGNAILVETTGRQARQFSKWMGVSYVVPATEEAQREAKAAWREGLQRWWRQRAPTVALTTSPLTVNFHLDRAQVSGTTERLDTIYITLVDSNGELLAETYADPFPAASGGYLYAITLSLQDSHRFSSYATGGDILTVRQGAEVVTLEVPLLTALADQLNEIVYGQAPPGGELTIIRHHDGTATQHRTAADAEGKYELLLPGLFPPDYGYVYHRLDERRQVGRRFNVPYLRIGISGGELVGALVPNASFTITVKSATGELRHQTTVRTSSEGTPYCPYYGCWLADLEAGYTIVVEGMQTISLTVPLLTALPDAATGRVTGQAPPDSTLSVALHGAKEDICYYESCWPPSLDEPDHTLTVTSSPDGTYEADFSGLTALGPGDYGAVTYTDPAGHRFYRRYGLPRIGVHPEEGRIYGELFAPNSPITITVTGKSGYTKDILYLYTNRFGGLPNYRYEPEEDIWTQMAGGGYRPWPKLQPGERIQIESPDPMIELEVPLITLRADRETGLITGQAPPNTPLRITLYSYYSSYGPKPTPTPSPPYPLSEPLTLTFADGSGGRGPITRYVTSTISGSYSADFSELAPLQPNDKAHLLANVGGHHVSLRFLSLVPMLRVDMSERSISGYVDVPMNSYIRILIRDERGRLKRTMTLSLYHGTFATGFYPPPEPGDTIEVEGGRQPLRMTLPRLSARADRATNRIIGEAPPGSTLIADLFHFPWPPSPDFRCPWPFCWEPETHTFTTTATTEGEFTVNLGETVRLTAGDRGDVTYRTPDGNEAIVHYSVPRLSSTLGAQTIDGLGPPNSSVRITVTSASGEVKATSKTTTNPYGHFYVRLSDPIEPGDQIVLTEEEEEKMLAILTVPLLTAEIDPAGQVVRGQAPPEALLGIWLYREDGAPFSAMVTSTASGNYGISLGEANISAGDAGGVLYRTPEGHLVSTLFGFPRLEVTLEKPIVTGYWQHPTSWKITATLLHPDGSFKGSASSTATNYSSRFSLYLMSDEGEPTPVQSGDILIVSDSSYVITLVVPPLTVEAHAGSHLILGQAPPRKLLEITLEHKGFPYSGKYVRRTRSDVTGTYGLDLGELMLWPGDHGAVSFTDERGNTIATTFSIPYFSLYYPLMLKDEE